jgi:hypothetical protein
MDPIDNIDVDRLINNILKKMMPLSAFFFSLHPLHIAPQFSSIAKALQSAMPKKDHMSRKHRTKNSKHFGLETKSRRKTNY